MKKKKIIGIDYSLSSPAICVCRGDFKFDNCKIYYLTNVKKYEGDFGNINGRLHLFYTLSNNDTTKYRIGRSIIDTTIGNIFIEGYSYGSKGLVFNLAENMNKVLNINSINSINDFK